MEIIRIAIIHEVLLLQYEQSAEQQRGSVVTTTLSEEMHLVHFVTQLLVHKPGWRVCYCTLSGSRVPKRLASTKFKLFILFLFSALVIFSLSKFKNCVSSLGFPESRNILK